MTEKKRERQTDREIKEGEETSPFAECGGVSPAVNF